jgi:hypothetical protein
LSCHCHCARPPQRPAGAHPRRLSPRRSTEQAPPAARSARDLQPALLHPASAALREASRQPTVVKARAPGEVAPRLYRYAYTRPGPQLPRRTYDRVRHYSSRTFDATDLTAAAPPMSSYHDAGVAWALSSAVPTSLTGDVDAHADRPRTSSCVAPCVAPCRLLQRGDDPRHSLEPLIVRVRS